MSLVDKNVHWSVTGDPLRPWTAWYDGQQWEIAVRDAGGRRTYQLLVAGRVDSELEAWPPNWTRAEDDAAQAAQRAEFERENEYWEKNKDVLPIDEADLD